MNIYAIDEASKNEAIKNTQVSSADAVTPDSFENTLKTSGKKQTATLDDLFNKAAKKYNVDVNLLKAIAKQESNFQADAVSKAGAQGIMQLMPATAKAMGVKNAMDPEQNIMGGAKLISQLLKKYNGDVKLALAGYNAGIGNVAKYNGIPPFKETQNYIKKVMNYYKNGVNAPNCTYAAGKEGSQSEGISDSELHIIGIYGGTPARQTAPDASLLADSGEDIFSYQDYMRFIDIFMSMMQHREI